MFASYLSVLLFSAGYQMTTAGGLHLQGSRYVGSSGWAPQMQLVGAVMSFARCACARMSVCMYSLCDAPEVLP